MEYAIGGTVGAVVGFFAARVNWGKEISIGKAVLGKVENDAEYAWRWISSLPAKIKSAL